MKMPSVPLRSSTAAVSVNLILASVSCANASGPANCPKFGQFTGSQVLAYDSNLALVPQSANNFSAWPGAGPQGTTNLQLKYESLYYFVISAPLVDDPGLSVQSYCGQFVLDWPTSSPVWVIILIVVAALLGAGIVLGLGIYVYQRARPNPNYEQLH
ncbi:MAG: hypothetical protein Q8P67_02525 [archaeon]|nr:hypothetical protein [archaeon]